MISVKRRVLKITLTGFVLCWLITTVITLWNIYSAAPRFFDQDLINYSDLLVRVSASNPEILHNPELLNLDIPYKIIQHQRVLAHSVRGELLPQPTEEGLSTRTLNTPSGTETWRIFSQYNAVDSLWTVVGERRQGMTLLMDFVFAQIMVPNLIALIMVITALIWGTKRGLKPLSDLALQVSRRTPNDMTPIKLEEAPLEINPVITELNDLLTRLGKALENEHRFTGNAAHELRTPLAAVKTEVQVLGKLIAKSSDQEKIGDTLNRINIRVDRSTHLINQLLTLSRVESLQEVENLNDHLLEDIIDHSIGELREKFVETEILIVKKNTTQGRVRGDFTLLSILFGNLIDNSIRYSDGHGAITIEFEESTELISAIISDDGPGVPEHQIQDIFKNFYRVPGTAQRGTGLGLAIAQRIVELHEAKMTVSNKTDSTGLQINLRFSRRS